MPRAKNLLKESVLPFTIMLILLLISFSGIHATLATEEPNNNNQPGKPAKYSKFFDKKTKWCDALVITCTDFRFTTATQEFINNRLGMKGNYDYISIPGSIRNLLDRNTRDLVLNNFGVSVRLHYVKRVIILGHEDCSIGYGGSKKFKEPIDEYKTICKDLKKARTRMGIRFPHLKVYLYYATILSENHQRIYNFEQIL
ncbi:MAG: hypothetical protein CV087_01390 [Candidatus Brocadia sp. WS118]|nr:MAG: hypothetical protein CV087_01390 [Candidatus Brocadia sp. WS118]